MRVQPQTGEKLSTCVRSGARGLRVGLAALGAGRRALLAGSHESERDFLWLWLSEWGLRLVEVEDGVSALRALAQAHSDQDPFAVALFCPGLSGLDGCFLGQVIRRDPLLGRTGVIVWESADRETPGAATEGASLWVTLHSPIGVEELARAVTPWLVVPNGEVGSGPKLFGADPGRGTVDFDPLLAGFDSVGLLDRVAANPALARQLALRFLGDLPEQLQALRAAVESAEESSIEFLAHRIKGAAANVGGEDVRRVAGALEYAGYAGKLSTASVLFPRLVTRCERLAQGIRFWLLYP